MKQEIKLGDKVKCKLTGFIGIAVSKTEFINGCVQWEVLPRVNKSNKIPEPLLIDEQSLEIIRIKKKKAIKKKEGNGGAMRKAFPQRGF